MSLGEFGVLPPELIAAICNNLSFDEVVALQDCHITLELIIGNVFFTKFKKAEIVWDENDSILTFSGPSVSPHTLSSSNSRIWRDVIRQTRRVRNLRICKYDAARNFDVLDEVSKYWKLHELTITMKRSSKTTSPKTCSVTYKKLTACVSSQRRSLRWLRVENDPDSFVQMDLRKKEAELHYEHYPNLQIHTQLIYPVFHAMLAGRAGPRQLTLRIDGTEQLEFALQNAFQTALPYAHRDTLRVLKLEFGSKIASITQSEMHRVLTAYAPYLNTTRQLQQVICDLTKSTLDPSCLESMYMTISRELRSSHRISLLTSVPESQPDIGGGARVGRSMMVW